MEESMVEKLLAGASLRCVMQPDDEIPGNRPLHDECFQLPHVIVDGKNFTAITGRDIVTKPGADWPIVFYYTNYLELFGTFNPVQVEPGYGEGSVLRMFFSPRKRYRKFEWLLNEKCIKIWDSEEGQDFTGIRAAVRRAAPMKAIFLDEEQVWNIHPILLPQVACNEDSFMMQTAYIAYPQIFRQTGELEKSVAGSQDLQRYLTDAKSCFTRGRESNQRPFHAFYNFNHDGTYKSYYDLARGETMHRYQRLMIFAEQ